MHAWKSMHHLQRHQGGHFIHEICHGERHTACIACEK